MNRRRTNRWTRAAVASHHDWPGQCLNEIALPRQTPRWGALDFGDELPM